MEERRILSSTRHISTDIARTNFTTVRKGGLDPHEVRLHLETVAREVSHLENRVRELTEQLSEAQHRASNPSFDEATLATALGTQGAAILRTAHDEAGRVTAEAQERSAQLFSDSQKRAASHLMEAQERATAMITDAERAAGQIDVEARQAAERLISTAHTNASTLVDRGREQGRAIVEQATGARRTILNDLAIKRKALHIQIDQLRAARDAMTQAVQSLRSHVEELLSDLATSDDVARQAALDALRLRPPSSDPSHEELLSGTPLRIVPEASLEANADVATEVATPQPAPKATSKREPKATPVADVASFVEEDVAGTDVVNEIFARLRKATLEERGASAAPAKKTVVAAPVTPTSELVDRRDAALQESLASVTRKVKRALQDDQNVTLERLRDVRGDMTEYLEEEMVQRARYDEAAHEALADAARAGVLFARTEAGRDEVSVDPALVSECSADLAVTIVLALRKRIMADGNGEATDRANAAYREWRGARVERLCTDAARRAFHLGVMSASAGGHLRFIVAPNEAPCDACTLDAAAPPRVAGQPFPSGSLYPPLHAGCACTVIPA